MHLKLFQQRFLRKKYIIRERENVYQFVKKKLEGPETSDKIKRKWLETIERDLFSSRKKDVKLTVVARIGCTPYTAPAYGQTCVRTLPYVYAVVNSTTRNWAHLTSKHPQSPQKMGEGDYGPGGFLSSF